MLRSVVGHGVVVGVITQQYQRIQAQGHKPAALSTFESSLSAFAPTALEAISVFNSSCPPVLAF